MQRAARYLVLIESAGSMVARLFDLERRPLVEFDASSEEVAVMTSGLMPARDALAGVWDSALAGHNRAERAAAQVFTLDI
jgi:hypothetical protein